MKKSLIITTGIIIVTLLVAIWVYLLFFGTPRTPNEIFANLGVSGGIDSEPVANGEEFPLNDPVVQIAAPTSALQQLTTRPIAGMQVQTMDGERLVWYMERGTGYIYQINLVSRIETLLSQVTIPQVTTAIFSPSGSSVMYTKSSPVIEHTVALFATTSDQLLISDFISLPPMAENIVYETDSTVLYTVASEGTTTGYRYNLQSEIREELFIIPLTQVNINWGAGRDSIVVYTKPDYRLPGYAYTVQNNQLTPYHQSGKGLVVMNSDHFSAHTLLPDGATRPQTTFFTKAGSEFLIPQLLIPEKCTYNPVNEDMVWCATPSNEITAGFINSWYEGTVTSSDYLWSMSISGGLATLLSAFESDMGRSIDAVNLRITPDQSTLLFKNRIDNTLWLYDFTF